MNVYKLKYQDRKAGISDLIEKGIIDENESVISINQSLVDIGLIILENATYDDSFNEIKLPVYADGYHFDLLSDIDIDFENLIEVKNPKHVFAGYEKN